MTLMAFLRAPHSEKNRGKKNNKLVIAANISKKSNITTYEYIRNVYYLGLKHKTFLDWNTP